MKVARSHSVVCRREFQRRSITTGGLEIRGFVFLLFFLALLILMKIIDSGHGGNISISSEEITLKNLQPEQSGEYTCVVDQRLKTYRSLQEKNFDLMVVGELKKSFEDWLHWEIRRNKLDLRTTKRSDC
jgi:hypothetical protein